MASNGKYVAAADVAAAPACSRLLVDAPETVYQTLIDEDGKQDSSSALELTLQLSASSFEAITEGLANISQARLSARKADPSAGTIYATDVAQFVHGLIRRYDGAEIMVYDEDAHALMGLHLPEACFAFTIGPGRVLNVKVHRKYLPVSKCHGGSPFLFAFVITPPGGIPAEVVVTSHFLCASKEPTRGPAAGIPRQPPKRIRGRPSSKPVAAPTDEFDVLVTKYFKTLNDAEAEKEAGYDSSASSVSSGSGISVGTSASSSSPAAAAAADASADALLAKTTGKKRPAPSSPSSEDGGDGVSSEDDGCSVPSTSTVSVPASAAAGKPAKGKAQPAAVKPIKRGSKAAPASAVASAPAVQEAGFASKRARTSPAAAATPSAAATLMVPLPAPVQSLGPATARAASTGMAYDPFAYPSSSPVFGPLAPPFLFPPAPTMSSAPSPTAGAGLVSFPTGLSMAGSKTTRSAAAATATALATQQQPSQPPLLSLTPYLGGYAMQGPGGISGNGVSCAGMIGAGVALPPVELDLGGHDDGEHDAGADERAAEKGKSSYPASLGSSSSTSSSNGVMDMLLAEHAASVGSPAAGDGSGLRSASGSVRTASPAGSTSSGSPSTSSSGLSSGSGSGAGMDEGMENDFMTLFGFPFAASATAGAASASGARLLPPAADATLPPPVPLPSVMAAGVMGSSVIHKTLNGMGQIAPLYTPAGGSNIGRGFSFGAYPLPSPNPTAMALCPWGTSASSLSFLGLLPPAQRLRSCSFASLSGL